MVNYRQQLHREYMPGGLLVASVGVAVAILMTTFYTCVVAINTMLVNM